MPYGSPYCSAIQWSVKTGGTGYRSEKESDYSLPIGGMRRAAVPEVRQAHRWRNRRIAKSPENNKTDSLPLYRSRAYCHQDEGLQDSGGRNRRPKFSGLPSSRPGVFPDDRGMLVRGESRWRTCSGQRPAVSDVLLSWKPTATIKTRCVQLRCQPCRWNSLRQKSRVPLVQ